MTGLYEMPYLRYIIEPGTAFLFLLPVGKSAIPETVWGIVE